MLESTEDQWAREQQRHVRSFEVGQMVDVYRLGPANIGYWLRAKVTNIFKTVDHEVPVYELRTADGSYYHATKDYIKPI